MLQGAFANFEEAGREVLAYLHDRIGFSLWMVTRTERDDWIVLQTLKDSAIYQHMPGDVFRWSDMFCARMVEGDGPRVAPLVAEVPAYTSTPVYGDVDIGAYVGVPLANHDGSLFGTLCAIDPEPQPADIAAELPTIELCAGLLSTILKYELAAAAEERRADVERLQQAASADRPTGAALSRGTALAEFLAPGVLDPDGWEQLLDWEEARAKRFGHPACILSVKLAADARRTGEAGALIREVVREDDVVAQVGPDELAVMSVECDLDAADELESTVRRALAGVGGTTRGALRSPQAGLREAWRTAREAAAAGVATGG